MPARTPTPCRDKLCRKTTRHAHGYCDEHADQAKAWTRGRAGRGRGGRAWRRIRDAVMVRDRYLCQACKRKGMATPASSVDHIKPEAEGGRTVPSNLEALCGPCHTAKTQAEALRARQRGD